MITQGDVLDVLQQTPDEHYAACFCDPPYGLSFMGKRWDHGVPSSDVWAEVWRVLRPGAILMAFGGTRTWHRLAVNIEDAGFEMFDTIMWVYGSGFPKSTDISKAIDKEAGAVREVVGRKPGLHSRGNIDLPDGWHRPWMDDPEKRNLAEMETAPATDAARAWAGYGSALKPAHEPILCFRKPRKATYAQTAQEWGTGALWIDGARVATSDDLSGGTYGGVFSASRNLDGSLCKAVGSGDKGRWPANIILDEHAAAALDQQSGELTSGGKRGGARYSIPPLNSVAHGRMNGGIDGDCFGDTGGASRFFQQCNIDEADRFFYAAKASRRERERGLEGLPLRDVAAMQGNLVDGQRLSGKGEPIKTPIGRNHHPCVKPLSLCEYLARLIVPPVAYRDDARLLVPFAGSGSEILGALRAGWVHVDGIELEADYIEIARRRIAADMPLFAGD
jgi:DNA modification methylase